MLSSRYLHLHEALGLGPMWLNRGAKVLPAVPAAAPAHAPQAAPETESAPAAARPAAAARLAAVAAVNKSKNVSDGLTATAKQTEQTVQASDERPSESIIAPATAVQPAEIMVVSICPAPEDGAAGQLFSGSAGVLLNNMLAAIGLNPADAHKTSWIKAVYDFAPDPPPESIAAALPQMQAELAASQAKAVLFAGQVFEQPHFSSIAAQLCGGTPCFTVPHPARLLRQPQLKKQAWAELKKLRSLLAAHT